MLEVEDPGGRIMVREALIVLGIPDREREMLIKSMLESPDISERFAVAYLLMQLGEPERAIPALKDLAGRGDKSTRACPADARPSAERAGIALRLNGASGPVALGLFVL